MLRFGSVTLDANHEPPRPAVVPRSRLAAIRRGTITGNAEYVEDWGLQTGRMIRFVSSETQGFLTPAEVSGLLSLYEAGSTFELETDLLSPHGASASTYVARFFPGDEGPVFTPAIPDGTLFYFDIPLLVY